MKKTESQKPQKPTFDYEAVEKAISQMTDYNDMFSPEAPWK